MGHGSDCFFSAFVTTISYQAKVISYLLVCDVKVTKSLPSYGQVIFKLCMSK